MVHSAPNFHLLVVAIFPLEKELQQLASYGVQHVCNHCTQGHPSLHNKFQASQNYITKYYLKKAKNEEEEDKEDKEKNHGDRLHWQVNSVAL